MDKKSNAIRQVFRKRIKSLYLNAYNVIEDQITQYIQKYIENQHLQPLTEIVSFFITNVIYLYLN